MKKKVTKCEDEEIRIGNDTVVRIVDTTDDDVELEIESGAQIDPVAPSDEDSDAGDKSYQHDTDDSGSC